MPRTKVCQKCGKTKTVDHFTRTKKGGAAFDPVCRACSQIAHRAWRTQLGREKYTPEVAS